SAPRRLRPRLRARGDPGLPRRSRRARDRERRGDRRRGYERHLAGPGQHRDHRDDLSERRVHRGRHRRRDLGGRRDVR
ncbi:hypothetical protein RZS08_65810, partial [Arthrospira platensis SPKY1]|nr:hypothetical protein [Arthrospira platensis SPKY1]